ncbi:MAG: sigma-54-dependent Fis family transcriptional regulator [Planctomycetes bacterium]|nr:sigma-54-dependent Fis family transcriptional regulator [Planctomycetota bacterium]
MTTCALVADDDALSRELLSEVVQRQGWKVVEAADGAAALKALRAQRPDVILSDVHMPGLTGVELARHAAECGGPPVILVTGQGSMATAVAALRAGAEDYLLKPVTPQKLEEALDRVRTRRGLCGNASPSGELIGDSPRLRAVVERLRLAARSRATILLAGESGTGKERLAALVHELSPRRERPFVKVNCAALAAGVLESELFGHERGAFTGALERRAGRFERADQGTLLLDEVSEVSTAVQAKLLRVLEEAELERVGGDRTLQVDVRVVATTNRDLQLEVERGTFRGDLYYRLAVLPIRVPPLRERLEDVPLLVEHFLARYAEEVPSRVRRFAPEAMRLLESHPWPGNVRELENLVRRAVLLDGGPTVSAALVRAELGHRRSHPSAAGPAQRSIRSMEREAIVDALRETGGRRERAAQLLGISVRTLYNRLKRYENSGAPIDFSAFGEGSRA